MNDRLQSKAAPTYEELLEALKVANKGNAKLIEVNKQLVEINDRLIKALATPQIIHDWKPDYKPPKVKSLWEVFFG